MRSIVTLDFQMYQWLRTIASVFMALLYTGPEGLGASSNAMSIAFRQLLCVVPNLNACRAAVPHVLPCRLPQVWRMADKITSRATRTASRCPKSWSCMLASARNDTIRSCFCLRSRPGEL